MSISERGISRRSFLLGLTALGGYALLRKNIKKLDTVLINGDCEAHEYTTPLVRLLDTQGITLPRNLNGDSNIFVDPRFIDDPTLLEHERSHSRQLCKEPLETVKRYIRDSQSVEEEAEYIRIHGEWRPK